MNTDSIAKAMKNNALGAGMSDEEKIAFVLDAISHKRNIYNLRRADIDDCNELLETMNNKLANYLWLIIYYEYYSPHGAAKRLDDQHQVRRTNAIRNLLNRREKELVSGVKTVTVESDWI